MSKETHATQMALASLLDAVKAIRRGNLDLADEKLERADRDLMRAAQFAGEERRAERPYSEGDLKRFVAMMREVQNRFLVRL
jgi:hypothetical protein